MTLPVVAIVGRPNVGKSSLFNWLAGRRIAIVDPTAGTTRDRLSSAVRADGCAFELTDTGGMGIEDVDRLTADVERQIGLAIERASVVLFLVDSRSGVMPLDELVADRLRHMTKPVILVANKCDTEKFESQIGEFNKLGHGEPLAVSAVQNRGKERLLDAIRALLPEGGAEPPAPEALKLAIVGRRNAGKSTFINSLAGEERVIVSEVPGTTRDSVDVRIERDGKAYIAIDTAGVRKKKSLANDLEFYSMHRAERSIRRADVVLLFFDAMLEISRVDKALAEYVIENHKPAIFVVNKWDMTESREVRTGTWGDYLRKNFPSLDFVPIAFITAKNGRNVRQVLQLAQALHEQACARVTTGDLNRVLRWAIEKAAPPMRENRRPKIYYGTQVRTNPPSIVLMTNGPELFDNTYLRYIEKTFRDQLPFTEVPIKLTIRSRHGATGPSVEEREEATTPASAAPAKKRSAKRERDFTVKTPRAKGKPKREASSDETGLWDV